MVILDSLDQLRDKGGNLKEWLPSELSPHVVFIMSAIPTEEFVVVQALKVSEVFIYSSSFFFNFFLNAFIVIHGRIIWMGRFKNITSTQYENYM